MAMAAAGLVVNGAEGAGGLKAAAGMYEQLKGEWSRKSPNLSKCGEALGRLKVRGGAGGDTDGRTDGAWAWGGPGSEGGVWE